MKQIKKDIFENLVKATENTFSITEPVAVEHYGNDIAVYVPSKTLGFQNWNGKGNNDKVNVTLRFSSPVENHSEDLEVTIRTYVHSVKNTDEFYGIDIKSLKDTYFSSNLDNEINNKIGKYLEELKENNLLIKSVEDSGYNCQRVEVYLDNNNNYKNNLENIVYLQKLIKAMEQRIEDIIEEAKQKVKAKLDADENEYQELKRLRNLARKEVRTVETTLSKSTIVQELNNKELSQEQLQKILEVIK